MDINEFDIWNEQKKDINQKVLSKEFYFRSQEIWWCSLGVNIGIEANGKNEVFERPVLIIKVFNKEMIWVVPVTSTLKKLPFYYSFKFDDQDYSINITQIRTISAKRLLRKVSTINTNDFANVLNILIDILKNETPTLSGGISEPEGDNEISIAKIKK